MTIAETSQYVTRYSLDETVTNFILREVNNKSTKP